MSPVPEDVTGLGPLRINIYAGEPSRVHAGYAGMKVEGVLERVPAPVATLPHVSYSRRRGRPLVLPILRCKVFPIQVSASYDAMRSF
jgi:hypothetical protein